jgi:hypothetical protein
MEKIYNDHFKMSEIGRGIWFDWQSVGFSAKNKQDIINLYEHILIFNGRIRCRDCGIHSTDYLVDTSNYITKILTNSNLTDSEIIDLFNRWLYEYHNAASLHSGKDSSTFPTYDEVAEFHADFKVCEAGCSDKH